MPSITNLVKESLSDEELSVYTSTCGNNTDSMLNGILITVIGTVNNFLLSGGYKVIVGNEVPIALQKLVIDIVIYTLLKRMPIEIEISRTDANTAAMSMLKDVSTGVFLLAGIDRMQSTDNITSPGASKNYKKRLSTLN